MKTVEFYLSLTGVLDLVDAFKSKGVPMRQTVAAVTACSLMGRNSMSGCAEWLGNPNVRAELGIPGRMGQRTLNRGVEILGARTEEVIARMWKGLCSAFGFANTDVDTDGTAVACRWSRAGLAKFGYDRDRSPGKKQVEFMTARLQESRIPMFVKEHEGNATDPEMFREVLPAAMGMVRKGSWTVTDDGGASEDVLNNIVKAGNNHLARVKMNASDDAYIREHRTCFEAVEDGVCCLKRVFKTSGRTTYVFFSAPLAMKAEERATSVVEKRVATQGEIRRTGKIRNSDFFTVKARHPGIKVDPRASFQDDLLDDAPESIAQMIEDEKGPRCGFFKLESSVELTPLEALMKYRNRVAIEHLISSMKRVAGIKPLRVWSDDSVRGSMLLALLAEAVIAMARHEMRGREEEKKVAGKAEAVIAKPSEESIVRSLARSTVAVRYEGRRRLEPVYSNWERISTETTGDIRSRAAA
ncbi:MAG: transposase [Candidatus Methanoplasma sp.]|nr:transposase [Candidatus Methanoplasma sp.]